MNRLFLPALLLTTTCLPTAASDEGQGGATQLTLDPALYAEALREVQGVEPGVSSAATPVESDANPALQSEAGEALPAPSAPAVEDWQAALRDAGTELADVRLLVLLQRLNPLDPPASRAEDYAEVLRLHHLMLAGNARACLILAAACRAGHFEGGLIFIQSAALAEVLERRAAAFHLAPVSGVPASDTARPSAPRETSGGRE